MRTLRGRLPGKGQFRCLVWLQERYDKVDPCLTPAPRLIVKPICTAGTRDDPKSSSPRTSDPKHLRCHSHYSATSWCTTSREHTGERRRHAVRSTRCLAGIGLQVAGSRRATKISSPG